MTTRRSLLLVGMLVLTGTFRQALPDVFSTLDASELLSSYQKLRTLALDSSRVAVAENVGIKKDAAAFQFKTGHFYFLEPLADRVTGAVFLGEGVFRLKPPTAIELRQMARFNEGRSALEESFKELVLLFSDGTFEELAGQFKTSAGSVPRKASELLEGFRKKFRERARYNVEALVLSSLCDRQFPYFLAEVKGEKHGLLSFEIDTRALEAVQLARYKPNQGFELWNSFRPSGDTGDTKDLVDTITTELDVAVGRGEKISAKARLEFTAMRDGPRMLKVNLAPTLRVQGISDGAGLELKFIQEDKKKDADLWVLLPKPLVAGEKHVWNLAYEGDEVIEKAGSGNFFVGERTSWYPRIDHPWHVFGDRSMYKLKFRVPKGNTLVATGKLARRHQDGNFEISQWETEVPYTVAGFNYGKYKLKSLKHDDLEVTVYANPGLNDQLRGLQMALERNPELARMAGITTGGFNTTAVAERTGAEAMNSMRLFSHYFGEIPFRSISVTQQPGGYFGQSWPTLVFMPFTALLDDTIKHQLGLSWGPGGRFFEEVGPHEIAHQWWGHIVSWKSYHDQWLSEGFAQFSTGLYRHRIEGEKKFKSFLESERRAVLDKLVSGERANDVGPIWLGHRLSSEKTPGGYRLVYHKGGYVVHMIRMMLYDFARDSDARFIALMKDFVQAHHNKAASTEDFKVVTDKHFGTDMGWFFQQWVYGTELPKVEVRYAISETSGGAQIRGEVMLKDVSPDFLAIIPVVMRKGQGIVSGRVRAQGEVTPFQSDLPVKPDSVEINPLNALLCELKVSEVRPEALPAQ